MKKRDWALVSLFVFAVLCIVRFVGPIQPFFTWTHVTTRIANAILIVAFAGLLTQWSHVVFDDKKLLRITHVFIIVGALVTLFFAYYEQLTALFVSLGILAAAFTFIFQAPLLSFVAWVYIEMAEVYRRNDRIRIGDIKGDVVEITVFQTKVLEVGGEYVGADLPSGRVSSFPNSLVLSQPVLNYTRKFPYVWIDLSFQLTYNTDFGFVMKNVEKIVKQYLRKEWPEMKKGFESVMRRYRQKDGFPGVGFNIVPQMSWVDLRVSVPVEPHAQSRMTTDIAEKILAFFKKHPKKVAFPLGRFR